MKPTSCRPARAAAWIAGWLAVCSLAAAAQEPDIDKHRGWTVYRNVKLDIDRHLDGDSFTTITAEGPMVFRLYYVDAPETDTSYKSRNSEQGRAFGVSSRKIPGYGKQAAEFTRAFLKKPFTVYTRKEDAQGRSALPRYFALIETEAGWLHEALTEAGWARVYGKPVTLPDGASQKTHWRLLEELQAKALRDGAGVWADSKLRPKE